MRSRWPECKLPKVGGIKALLQAANLVIARRNADVRSTTLSDRLTDQIEEPVGKGWRLSDEIREQH